MGFAKLFLTIYFTAAAVAGFAQSHNASAYDHLANPKIQKEHILFLTQGESDGRATGSRGAYVAKEYIEEKFKEYGLESRGILYYQPFREKSVTGYNIIGEVKASVKSSEYIIIGAHYDHLGKIKGKVYPGADDNASGVAALLELGRMFAQMKKDGKFISKNILFIAFDGKEMNMAGSRNFLKVSKIHPQNIKCMVNIDQIGSTFAPPHKDPNYVLVLGSNTVEEWAAQKIDMSNRTAHLNLDIDYTFYNSEAFYKIFYTLSDHHSFAQAGIPAVFFTSGITNNTYKETDTEQTISYPVLTNRIKLIFHFVYNLIN